VNKKKGIVYLVGAGPGDASLLTLKGLWCLEQADVVVFDRLACEYMLTFCRPDAELIYVGKETNRHTLKQEEINSLLVTKAREGKVVCRLKGGDPFVFGRGGEEAESLVDNGLPFEIVPGVTSAVAVPAYAGIPVTHRDHASALTVITGHRRSDSGSIPLKEDGSATAIYLMGYENLNAIISGLLDEGWKRETPAALIRWGTRAEQQTVVGTLANIEDLARDAECGPPAVFVVGDVVTLREKLMWREKQPLFGKRILITRPRHQARELAQEIILQGGEPLCLPAIELEATADCGFDFSQLPIYDLLIFTSANGVFFFLEQLRANKIDVRCLRGKLAAIGPATAASLEQYGLNVDLIPKKYQAESLLEELKHLTPPGTKVLIPRAQGARDVLPEGLTAQGVQVDILTLYRAVPALKSREWISGFMKDISVDYLTFTSSSTVRSYLSLCNSEKISPLPGECRVACIGPVTAATARELGLPVHVVAMKFTAADLLAAIIADVRGEK
jgi:uroporphyrinogen III methyltransferase/synthase